MPVTLKNKSLHVKNGEGVDPLDVFLVGDVERIVNAWLHDHPEATTTVQPKSLTYDKFADGALGYVIPNAAGDGITDDTQALQEAFDSSHFVYIPDGTYLISSNNSGWGHITEGGIFPQSDSLIVMSKNAVLKAEPNSNGFYNILNLDHVENVTIIGGKIEGEKLTHSGSAGEFGYGIRVSECSNVLIEDVEVYNCWGDAIIFDSTNETTGENVHCVVSNCRLHDCMRQGISVVIGEDICIKNCEIYNIAGKAPQSGIDIESNGVTDVIYVTIQNCYIHDTAAASVVCANQYTKGVYINGCILEKGVNAFGGSNIFISNSQLSSIRIAAEDTQVTNCLISSVDIESGNARFENCRVIGEASRQRLIFSGLDNVGRSSEEVVFENCYIDSTNCEYLLELANSVPACDGAFSFKNCKIKSKSILFSRLPYKELSLVDCDIETSSTPYQIFTVHTLDEINVVLKGNKLKFPEKPTFLFSSAVAHNLKVFMSENDISYYSFMYSSNDNAKGDFILTSNRIIAVNKYSFLPTKANNVVQHVNDYYR